MIFLIYFWCALLKIYENVSVISNGTLFSTDHRNYKTINELALDLERSEEARVQISSTCSYDDIRANIQCFSIVPNSSYTVEINQTIEMPCVVNNQHGKVQWRANSALLGYDRIVHGRPRYRIVGDPSKGEHILQIRNIKVEDSGKYECQVQPIGVKHPALRSITRLEVIVLPESPQIYYEEKFLADGILEVSIKKQLQYMELKCVSKHGRPPVSFNWYINEMPACFSISNCDIQNPYSYLSKLRFLQNDLKSIRNISCIVINTATIKYPTFQNIHTVRVIIQTPPNIPEIQSFTNEKVIEVSEHESIKLFCHSTPPGYPATSLYWEWRRSGVSSNHSHSVIDKNYFTVIYNKMSTISSLHLSQALRQFHSGYIHCVANHPTGLIFSTGVQIMIKYPPQYINITYSSEFSQNIYQTQNVIYLSENEVKKISCLTSEYYGDVNLKWKMNVDKKLSESPFRTVEKVWQIESSYKRQSTISISMEKSVDEIRLSCVLFFMERLMQKTSVKILKIKIPKEIQIENYHSATVVEENKTLKLVCRSEGGRPLPELIWMLNGDAIVKSRQPDYATTKTSVVLLLKIKRSHNTAILRCQTQLTFAEMRPLISKTIKLTVVFPPLNIKIENSFTNHLLENENVFFNCYTTESNPPSGLVWKIKICKFIESETCTEDILPEVKEYISSGTEYRGYVTKSVLKLHILWKYHLSYLVCESIFSYTQIEYPILRTQIQLFVSFKPNFLNIQNHSHIFLKLDAVNQSINVKTFANPLPIQYKWFYKSQYPIIRAEDGSIFFRKVDKSIMQEYRLVASNKLGDSVLVFYVDVTYTPTIVGKRVEKHRVQSKVTELECLVESNPPPQFSFINWTFLGPQLDFSDVFDERKQKNFSCNQGLWYKKKLKLFVKCRLINEKRVSSSLIIYDTSPFDVGTYVCSAGDKKSLAENKTIELTAFSIPHFIEIPLYSKVAVFFRTKSQAKTLIYSGILPNITLCMKLINNKTFVFPSLIKHLGFGIYSAISEFNWHSLDDIDSIHWKAENKFGNSKLFIKAVRESIPDCPLIEEIKFLPPHFLFVKIIQTFDGGHPQTFEIFWREVDQNITERKMIEEMGNYSKKYILKTIPNVYKNQNYEVEVCSKNQIYGRCLVCPKKILYPDGRQSVESNVEETNDNLYELIFQFNLKIVIAVAAFVFGLILLAISIIIFLFKRKQHQSTPNIRSNIAPNIKNGNDLLLPNIAINDYKLEYHSLSSMDKTMMSLYQNETQYSQSKI